MITVASIPTVIISAEVVIRRVNVNSDVNQLANRLLNNDHYYYCFINSYCFPPHFIGEKVNILDSTVKIQLHERQRITVFAQNIRAWADELKNPRAL